VLVQIKDATLCRYSYFLSRKARSSAVDLGPQLRTPYSIQSAESVLEDEKPQGTVLVPLCLYHHEVPPFRCRCRWRVAVDSPLPWNTGGCHAYRIVLPRYTKHCHNHDARLRHSHQHTHNSSIGSYPLPFGPLALKQRP
jgi:hypothetical protein